MSPSAATFARGTAMAIVLIVAAIAGLVVGYALDGRDGSMNPGAGGQGPFPNVWGNVIDAAVAEGAPGYADPYRRLIEEASSSGASLTAPTPR